MQFDWETIRNIAAILGIITFCIVVVPRVLKRKNTKEMPIIPNKMSNSSILSLETEKPKNKPPVGLDVGLLIFYCFSLLLGLLGIYLYITGQSKLAFDMPTLIFFVAFICMPIYVIVDYFVIQPRIDKRGMTYMAKEAKLRFNKDIDTVFDCCIKSIETMRGELTTIRKPNRIEAQLGNSLEGSSIIKVNLRHTKNNKTSINIVCDSQWLTTRFDLGQNKKYLNKFIELLKKEA